VAYAAAGSSCSSSGAGSTAATARTIFAAAAGVQNATGREIKKTEANSHHLTSFCRVFWGKDRAREFSGHCLGEAQVRPAREAAADHLESEAQ
jgi:hypothetical protein